VKILDRKLLRELYGSKGLLLAITSIVAVGMTCFVSIQSAYHNLQEAKNGYYRRCRMADFWIDLKKAPLADLDDLEELQGITHVRSRIQFRATVDLEDVPKPINALVLSLPDQRQPVINDIILRNGDYFSEHGEDEVIVNAAFARHHRLYPGSRVRVLVNNRRQELLVVGTAISSEFTYLLGPGAIVPDPKNFAVFYVSRSFAEENYDFSGAANQVVGRVDRNQRTTVKQILDEAERKLAPYGVFTTIELDHQLSNQFLTGEIDGLGATAAVIPAIFMVVAALVLNVLITRLARQQRTVIGTLKALGYTDWQVVRHFLKFGLSVGIVGGLAGSFLGYLAATGMTNIYRLFFEFPALQSGFYWSTHALGMTVSLACAVAGSLHGSWHVLRLQPAAAMRPESPRRGRRIWIEHFSRWWSSLSSSWRLALRGLFRARLRTAAGMFAASMGTALLLSGLMMMEIQNYMIDFQFHRMMRNDFELSFSSERDRGALDDTLRLPGVDRAEPTLGVACTMIHGSYRRKLGISGLTGGARLTVLRDTEGRPIHLPETGLVVTDRLADILHVRPGDRVRIVPIKGNRRPVEAVVARVATSYLGLAAYARIDYLSHLVDESWAMSGVQLATNQQPGDVQRLYRELKRTPAIESITSRRELIHGMTETLIKNQYVFIGFLVLFSGIVFFGSVVNSSLVSLAERQHEVATYRALGYTPWQVGGMFLREMLLVNAGGTLLGLPLGYLLVYLTSLAYATNDLFRMPVVSSLWVWIVTVVLATVFALLAHLVVQLRIHRLDFLAALNVRE